MQILRDLGAQMVDFDFPALARAADLGTRILLAEAYAYHRENLAQSPGKYDVSFRERVLLGSRQTEAELREAQSARDALKREYAALFADRIDAIASPGRESISDTMESLISSPAGRRGSCTRMYNMSGMPALVMPMGFGKHGMPLGIQLAANHFAEDRIYQLASAYEAATPWVSRRPPL